MSISTNLPGTNLWMPATGIIDWVTKTVDKLTKQSGQNIKNIVGNNEIGGTVNDVLTGFFGDLKVLLLPLGLVIGAIVLLVRIKL